MYTPLLLFSTAIALSPLAHALPIASFVFDGDAPYTVNEADLQAALTCPNGAGTEAAPPVLLVHGTGSTGTETWGTGYVPALIAQGYTPCYIDIPGRAMGDMQVSAEYVAYNLHYISSLSSGLPTAVIAHSQGNPDVQWALQFWPSTQSVTRAFIALSPDFSGIDLGGSLLNEFCDDTDCQPSIWQQSIGSNFYAALHGAGNFRAVVPTTSVYTDLDLVVNPPATNAQLPGATVLSVQQLCPLRPTTHFTMPIDAAGFAFALDALQHDGTASLARAQQLPQGITTCLLVSAPDMDFDLAANLEALFNSIIKGIM
ncbi:alpha/beta-hydrolase [Polychaeton citri CBS 116435]|uniref:Alpha/beta-hydrolase n=1 Tax=Polychaeton citri CBS 116435 TaxID=1314669 RepID=A0A9P4Q771_9PEZI|nr:alpha/beta-hydrolase [Polychaeton citri CBS 116435]